MGLKSTLIKGISQIVVPALYREHSQGRLTQYKVLNQLILSLKKTAYGNKIRASEIRHADDFRQLVPLVDYEDIRSDIEAIAQGEKDVLFPGRPLYFCKSSGTTSGVKYIPLTRSSINEQIRAARNALFVYVYHSGKADFFDRKMIFLQGSPKLDQHGVIPCGRLSGIVYHHVPAWLNKNRLPSLPANCIEDWDTKVDAIVEETLHQRMGLISGIPPWVAMYFERLLERTGKSTIREIFPEFSLFAYGGVNYSPYKQKIESLIGFSIDTVETYPASEGFIAFSERPNDPGMLLNLNGGIYYEFIALTDYQKGIAKRLHIGEVETGVNYVLVLNTNAGLWGYILGDTVKFTSLRPYKIVVTGRIKHFISAFGEHVIAEEVERAMSQACSDFSAKVTEFTVAPVVHSSDNTSYHEWLVEFQIPPADMPLFISRIDELMQQQNVYYRDLREGGMLQQICLRLIVSGGFQEFMRSSGKLGGQNKVPRLTNDRLIADALNPYFS